jgi:hypothetical protein
MEATRPDWAKTFYITKGVYSLGQGSTRSTRIGSIIIIVFCLSEAILKKRANVNVENTQGKTPLDFAVMSAGEKVQALLRSAKGRQNFKDLKNTSVSSYKYWRQNKR